MSQRRLVQLDILRIIAVIFVLGRHMDQPPDAAPLAGLMSLWRRGGWCGVDLFFVLSGFLVSGLLFREHLRYGTLRPGRFLLRRGFKIYPPFYLMLAGTMLVDLVRTHSYGWHVYSSEALFVQNYLFPRWHHTWSLAVEEHFYLCLGIGAWLLGASRRKFGTRGVVALFIGGLLVILGLRAYTVLSGLAPISANIYGSHLRFDGLLFGVMLAYLFHHTPASLDFLKRRPWLVWGVCLLLVSHPWAVSSALPLVRILGATSLYLGFGGIMLMMLDWRIPENGWLGAFANALAYLGAHSYSIYLWHVLVHAWGLQYLRAAVGTPIPYGLELLLYLVVSIVGGVAISKLVEVPTLRLRDRLLPSLASDMRIPAKS